MKKLLLLVGSIFFAFQVFAQDNNWTSGRFSSYVDVDANRPANSASEGFNIGRNYNTNIQLATKTWGGNHVIFFNAYKSSSMVPGSLITTGNSKFANSTTSYGSGAGAISFVGNGGVLGFYISDVSTGENTNVVWGYPKLSIQRNGNVGIGTSTPNYNLDVIGNIGLTTNPSSDYVLNRSRGVRLNNSSEVEFLTSTYGNNYGYRIFGEDPGRDGVTLFKIDYRSNSTTWKNALTLEHGYLGIGTTNPSEMLTVNGKILAEEVKVQNVPSSDYVFEPDYALRPIQEVETFVKENKHLPDIPSAEEFKKNGVGLGEMDDMLLRKVEELTLYVIELKRENEEQAKEINEIKSKLNAQ